jgi:hypothetical protein
MKGQKKKPLRDTQLSHDLRQRRTAHGETTTDCEPTGCPFFFRLIKLILISFFSIFLFLFLFRKEVALAGGKAMPWPPRGRVSHNALRDLEPMLRVLRSFTPTVLELRIQLGTVNVTSFVCNFLFNPYQSC